MTLLAVRGVYFILRGGGSIDTAVIILLAAATAGPVVQKGAVHACIYNANHGAGGFPFRFETASQGISIWCTLSETDK